MFQLSSPRFTTLSATRIHSGHYLFDEIGDSYPDNGVPYIAMRAFPAILGAMLVPMVYLILLKTNHSVAAAVLGAGMVLFGMCVRGVVLCGKRYRAYHHHHSHYRSYVKITRSWPILD